ncbi:Beta-lactamase domain protein [Streptomyces microflavus DSM 40593]|uniref:Beta-lactamase domain protein n=1 Tax=Streptomyces microflavus DSM 40593 TaxID=1303692 RepID=N0CTT7_STRMI|nr:alkyl sulfatase C-terminal domain-containing protein [Streptomyces microflavus]AGK78364.1 Beta-lactamase domain protein [Streptomyces microflavus DSM 40593]
MSNLPFDDTTDFANADRGFITALEPGKQLIDSLAVRVDGPRAWDRELVIDLVVTGPAQSRHRLTLHNGALTHRSADRTDQVDGVDRSGSRAPAGLTLTLTKPQLLSVLAGGGLDGIEQSGDASLLGDLFAVLAEPDKSFPIVTP